MSYHRFPICRTSGKVRFGERKDIKLALRQANRNRSQALLNEVPCSRHEIRAYHCSDCHGGWHLTAQPERVIRLVPAAELALHAHGSAAGTIRHTVADSELRHRKVA